MTSPPLRQWQPDRSAAVPPELPSFWTMAGRGACNRCPICGQGPVFNGFLTVAPGCPVCGTSFSEVRADDAPPYIVIFIVGHLLLPPIFWIEKAYMPPIWLQMAIWLPMFALISTLMLRPVKGAVLGWMLRLGPVGDAGQRAHAAREQAARDEAARGDADA
jgi:uncharacterized protein (DUF983 family)